MKALDTPLQYVLDHSSFSIGSKAKKAPETPPCQKELRVALAHWFHVAVNDRRRENDASICLSAKESRQVYNRLRRYAVGHVKMMAWACGKEGTTPPQAVAFWQSADQSKEGVPDAFLKGLRSHVLAFARSDLLTYDVEQMKQWLQQQAATVDASLALVTVVDAENATGGHACKTGDDNVNKGPLQNDTPDEWLFLNETNMENSKNMAPNKISNCRKAG